MKTFLCMLQFMTRIPVPLELEFTADRFVRGMIWLPLIGAVVGAVNAAVYLGASWVSPKEVASFLALLSWILITGGLHLDGLADTFDGVFSYRSRKRSLEIMKDSRLGTNGALALMMVLSGKYLGLVSLRPESVFPILIFVPAAGRLCLVLLAVLGNSARGGEGLGAFVNQTGARQGLIATLTMAPFFLFGPVKALICLLTAGAMSVIINGICKRRLGGVTGDTLGAAVELAEFASLFILILTEKLWNQMIP